jgi:hypothetical protein
MARAGSCGRAAKASSCASREWGTPYVAYTSERTLQSVIARFTLDRVDGLQVILRVAVAVLVVRRSITVDDG